MSFVICGEGWGEEGMFGVKCTASKSWSAEDQLLWKLVCMGSAVSPSPPARTVSDHSFLLGKVPALWILMAKFPLALTEISITLLPLNGLVRK